MVVAVDCFMKYMEAEAIATLSMDKIIRFIYHTIFCRYGVLIKIISDNSAQFDNAKFRRFCDDHEVHKRFSAFTRPQTNRQVEAVNKTLK